MLMQCCTLGQKGRAEMTFFKTVVDLGLVAAEDDVLAREQMGGRNGDGADLVQGRHRDPPFQAALEDQHHAVAPTDADGVEIRGHFVGEHLVFSVGEMALVSVVVDVEDGFLLGLRGRIGVDHVVGEIEMFGLVQKFMNH